MAEQQLMDKADKRVRDSLDQVRSSAQELYGAISDTLAKRSSATSADVLKLADKAQQSAEQARSAARQRYDAAEPEIQQRLSAAAARLDNAQSHAAESLTKSGKDLRNSLSKALGEARASALHVSEAIAAKRSQLKAEIEQPKQRA